MTAILTKTPAGDDIVILTRAEYERLMESEMDAVDVADANRSRDRIAAGIDEVLTEADMDALLAAPSPLAFWRKRRGLTQAALADKAGIAQGYLSEIESGRKIGEVQTLKRIAQELAITLDDLVP